MSSLTMIEKRRLEDLLGMASGYLLDCTNQTFAEFVEDAVRRDIYDLDGNVIPAVATINGIR